MVTQSPETPESDGLPISAAGQSCFFCGTGLLDPAICWLSAQQGAIFFHPFCLVDKVPGLLDEAMGEM